MSVSFASCIGQRHNSIALLVFAAFALLALFALLCLLCLLAVLTLLAVLALLALIAFLRDACFASLVVIVGDCHYISGNTFPWRK